MIENTQTAIALFLSTLTMGLAAGTVGLAVRQLLRRSAGAAPAHDERVHQQAHLIEVCLLTLGATVVLAWAQFFAVLKSYVPDLAPSGAMCAYGVTRINPGSALAVLVLLPTTLWCIGIFRMMSDVDHRTPTAVLLRRRLVVAAIAAMMALAASGAEVAYLFQDKAGRRVTCCTQFLAVDAIRPDADFVEGGWLPLRSHGGMLTAYFGANVAAVLVAMAARRKVTFAGTPSRLFWPFVAFVGIANLWLTRVAWKGSVAPLVLNLPHHHCVYELLTDTWAMGMAAGLSVAGNAGLLGLPALKWLSRPAGDEGRAGVGMLASGCAIMLATALLIVGIHLL